MLDYIKKFHNLSKELRDKVSAPAVMSAIEKLEKKYNVNLATAVMKIMVKEVAVNKLVDCFIQEFKLDKTKAEQLAKELKEQILSGAADYLGIDDLESRPADATLSVKTMEAKKAMAGKQQKAESRPADATPSVKTMEAKKAMVGKQQETENRKQPAPPRFAGQGKIINTQEVRPMSSIKESDLFFSDEDEAEIKELAKKIDSKAKPSLSDNEIEKQLDKTLAQTQINFGSEELVVRFRRILKIYLRGIRDRIDTKQTLIKPMDVGGLSFDQESAEQILKITDSNKMGETLNITPPEKIKIPKLEKEKLEDLKKSGVRDIDYDLASLSDKKSITSKEKIKEQDTGEVLKRLDTEHELAPPPPKLRKTSPPPPKLMSVLSGLQQDKSQSKQASSPLPLLQEVKPKEASPVSLQTKEELAVAEPKLQARKPEAEVEKKQEVKTKPAQEVRQIDARKADEETGKIKMEDVKVKFTMPKGSEGFRPKVMGPIDELKYMDLISFRRLDQDSVKIVEKIKEKINLLEEEDYAKRFKGIKAWRTSPVNKLYLKMGQASINESKPIDIIIKERKAAGKGYLNSKEFEAVTDLNRDLRF